MYPDSSCHENLFSGWSCARLALCPGSLRIVLRKRSQQRSRLTLLLTLKWLAGTCKPCCFFARFSRFFHPATSSSNFVCVRDATDHLKQCACFAVRVFRSWSLQNIRRTLKPLRSATSKSPHSGRTVWSRIDDCTYAFATSYCSLYVTYCSIPTRNAQMNTTMKDDTRSKTLRNMISVAFECNLSSDIKLLRSLCKVH